MFVITFWVIPYYGVNIDGLFQSEPPTTSTTKKQQAVNYTVHLVIGPCDTY